MDFFLQPLALPYAKRLNYVLRHYGSTFLRLLCRVRHGREILGGQLLLLGFACGPAFFLRLRKSNLQFFTAC